MNRTKWLTGKRLGLICMLLVLLLVAVGFGVCVAQEVEDELSVYLYLPLVCRDYDPDVNHPPDTPLNPSPSDGATDQSVEADLSWTGGDPDGDGVTYTVYFEAGDSTPDEMVASDQSRASYDPGTLIRGIHYYWQVVAADEHGATTAGPVWDFITAANEPANHPPYTPTSPSPPDDATNQPITVTLGWTGGDPDGDSVSYDVYFEADDRTPDGLICDGVVSTTCDVGTLVYGTHYYWQVVARDEHGATATGPVWDFSPGRVITVPLQVLDVWSTSPVVPTRNEAWSVAYNAAGYVNGYEGGLYGSFGARIECDETYSGWYCDIERSYLLADLPPLGGNLVSVSLELFGEGGPAALSQRDSATVVVHAGTWAGTGLPTVPADWQSVGEAIGSREFPRGDDLTAKAIPLSPDHFSDLTGVWKGVLRMQADDQADGQGFVTGAWDCGTSSDCFQPYLRFVVEE